MFFKIISCGGVKVAYRAHNPEMEVRFLPAQLNKNKFESLFGIVKKFSYIYIVNEKLIGDERYSVFKFIKKVLKILGSLKKFSYIC